MKLEQKIEKGTLEVIRGICSAKCRHCPHGRDMGNVGSLEEKVEITNRLLRLMSDVCNRVELSISDPFYVWKEDIHRLSSNEADSVVFSIDDILDIKRKKYGDDPGKEIANIYASWLGANAERLEKLPAIVLGFNGRDAEGIKKGLDLIFTFLEPLYSTLKTLGISQQKLPELTISCGVNDGDEDIFEAEDKFLELMGFEGGYMEAISSEEEIDLKHPEGGKLKYEIDGKNTSLLVFNLACPDMPKAEVLVRFMNFDAMVRPKLDKWAENALRMMREKEFFGAMVLRDNSGRLFHSMANILHPSMVLDHETLAGLLESEDGEAFYEKVEALLESRL